MTIFKPFIKTTLLILAIGVIVALIILPKLIERRNNAAKITPRPEIRVTIIEGKRREEIAKTMAEKGVCKEADFLTASEGKEGYLFPDTYLFHPDTPAQNVVNTMLENFSLKTKGLNLTTNDLILASIVEREAENDQERPIIAGVYNNRLKISMKLDADPTVQYARDNQELAGNPGDGFVFWKPITRSDYSGIISPYNTYKQTGLPPTPIANPGLKSLQAAANPAQHGYYYFFHRDGQIILSTTFAEHNRKLSQ